MENLSSSNEFSILIKAIKADSLTHLFDGNSPVTIFAPTNKAFEKLPAGKLDTLLQPAHKKELENLLTDQVPLRNRNSQFKGYSQTNKSW